MTTDCRLQPDWPAPSGVQARCSSRAGGQSLAPWDSLNLGDHVGDDARRVTANRAAWQRRMGVPAVFLTQVHGTGVVMLDHHSAPAQPADACFTTRRALACTIMVADCLPVLLTDSRGRWVAAAHAGWRGLAGHAGRGVLEVLAQRLADEPTVRAQHGDTLAWLGPCIGPLAFEVGAEVRAAFLACQPQADACFVPLMSGQYLADLAALARQRLRAAGITRIYGNDSSAPWCTVGNPDLFFSHRRDRITGRQAACVWLA